MTTWGISMWAKKQTLWCLISMPQPYNNCGRAEPKILKILFALTMLGDDRNIAATYVYGQAVYVKAQ